MRNIITITYSKNGYCIADKTAYQYDYGQQLYFDGFNLPDAYEVHLSNDSRYGRATKINATGDAVDIPDNLFEAGAPIFGWLFYTDERSGRTVFEFKVNVIPRPKLEEVDEQ